MARLRVIAAGANFHSGVVKLTPAQASLRAHSLEDLGDGSYRILRPITFKRGEEIEYDGPINKQLLQEVEQAAPTYAETPPALRQVPAREDLEAMTKAELVEFGASIGLELDQDALKAVLLEAIRQHLGA